LFQRELNTNEQHLNEETEQKSVSENLNKQKTEIIDSAPD